MQPSAKPGTCETFVTFAMKSSLSFLKSGFQLSTLTKGKFCLPLRSPVPRATLALHRHIPFSNLDDPMSENLLLVLGPEAQLTI